MDGGRHGRETGKGEKGSRLQEELWRGKLRKGRNWGKYRGGIGMEKKEREKLKEEKGGAQN